MKSIILALTVSLFPPMPNSTIPVVQLFTDQTDKAAERIANGGGDTVDALMILGTFPAFVFSDPCSRTISTFIAGETQIYSPEVVEICHGAAMNLTHFGGVPGLFRLAGTWNRDRDNDSRNLILRIYATTRRSAIAISKLSAGA